MRRLVVDTSLAVKWFLDEAHTDAAIALLENSGQELHAPSFIDIELGHVLVKQARRGLLQLDEARSIHRSFADFPVERQETSFLQDGAFELALQTGRGLYDCLFVTLAVILDTRLVTADRRLIDGFADTTWESHLVWIEDDYT